MTVLQKISDREPDLKRELKTSIELMLPYGGGAIHARAKRILKKLEADDAPGRTPLSGARRMRR
jgi:hypothetical protein